MAYKKDQQQGGGLSVISTVVIWSFHSIKNGELVGMRVREMK